MMSQFTPISALLGGALIGLAASALLLFHGRIAGVSGIVAGLLRPVRGDVAWRAFFVAGLVVGGVALALVAPQAVLVTEPSRVVSVVLAGLLVGFGARLGSGCTSGHGVCGLSRLSRRSLVATGTFMAAGVATVFVVRHAWGGLP